MSHLLQSSIRRAEEMGTIDSQLLAAASSLGTVVQNPKPSGGCSNSSANPSSSPTNNGNVNRDLKSDFNYMTNLLHRWRWRAFDSIF
ncbi:unnamed protein product [Linum trigynum]|uniref:Uncharacterized protein n=1 Tax=Linum trigynum TaxID=586398 RepID=A0AAV2GLQ3_9ROSI